MTVHPYTRLWIKHRAPAETDDAGLGYEVGDFWFDDSSTRMYQCWSNGDDAATWVAYVYDMSVDILDAPEERPSMLQ